MIKLYTRTGCPFCAKVLQKIAEADIPLEEKEISNEENLKELIELGGKRMVPFLVDDEKGVMMYESSDIVNYLEENYKK